MRLTQDELDTMFLKGKLSETEYLHLASDDTDTVAIAVDRVDGTTSVSLVKQAGKFSCQVFYPIEHTALDEMCFSGVPLAKEANKLFLEKVKSLETRGHEFDVMWLK